MTKKIRRTEINIETRKLTIIRSHGKSNPVYCRRCQKPVTAFSPVKINKMKQFSSVELIEITHGGKAVGAKDISVTSRFKHDAEFFFDREMVKANTLEIVKPLAEITFLKQNESPLWREGFEYELKIKPFGLFNLWGTHYLEVVSIDRAAMTIVTREKNNLCAVWNHTLTFKKTADNETEYTDRIIFYAGKLTGLLSYFLVYSYKKRHRNWNKLLTKIQESGLSSGQRRSVGE